MCESTLGMTEGGKVPAETDPDEATEAGAGKKLESKPVHFLHMSLLMGMSCATLILSTIKSASGLQMQAMVSMP